MCSAWGFAVVTGFGCCMFLARKRASRPPSAPITLASWQVPARKAWALVLRAGMAAGPGVHGGIAAMTSFLRGAHYDDGSGHVGRHPFRVPGAGDVAQPRLGGAARRCPPESPREYRGGPEHFGRRRRLLFAAIGIRLCRQSSTASSTGFPCRSGTPTPPRCRTSGCRVLGSGLLLSSINWFCFGASLWRSSMPSSTSRRPGSWETLALHTAYMALAYVAGFVIIIIPSGLGVREFF